MKKSFYLPGLLAVCSVLFSITAMATVPTITTNPGNDTVCSGATARFFITANDTPDLSPITIMWQVSTDGGGTWSIVTDTTAGYSGATTDTLSVAAVDSLNGYWYRSIATDTSGSDTSTGGLLAVNSPAAAITGASSVCAGSSITLSDAVAGGVWSHLYPAIDTVTPSGGVLTGISSGYDSITYTVNNACGTTTATKNIRVDVIVAAAPITGPTTTCVAHTIDLANANTMGTWTWSTSNGNAMITSDGTLTGVSGGLDVISYIFTNACVTDTSTLVVEIDTLLDPGTISGPTAVCNGSWIHLTETTTGGIWISSSSAIAIVDGSGNVTGASQGVATISYYLANGCGASVATYSVTVNTEAAPIGGTDSVGVGGTRTLTDATTGGVWSVSDTLATIDPGTGVVTGVAAGTETVTYTVTNLCGTSSATTTLYIGNPASSVIVGLGTVCEGSSITLTDSIAGGTWSSSNDTFATVNSISGVVTGIATGSVTISYTYTNGFGTATVTALIFVNHPPVISLTGPNVVAIGGNYIFEGIPADGAFTVSNPAVGQFIAFSDSLYAGVAYATYGSFVMLTAGTDIIHYKVVNTCGTADSAFTLSIITSNGVNTITNAASALNVYPNPNQGEFTFNLVTNTTEQATITITNIVGEKVKEFTAPTNQANNVQLDQPAGIYFMSANIPGGNYTAKITITK